MQRSWSWSWSCTSGLGLGLKILVLFPTLTVTRAETQITVQPRAPIVFYLHLVQFVTVTTPRLLQALACREMIFGSVKERILQKQASYVIPSYINDKEVHALRDTAITADFWLMSPS